MLDTGLYYPSDINKSDVVEEREDITIGSNEKASVVRTAILIARWE